MLRRTLNVRTGQKALKDTIASSLMIELMNPSDEVYFVVSELSDVPLLDNQLESYSDQFPRVRRRWIHLSDILLALTAKGVLVRIVCNTEYQQTERAVMEFNEKIEIRHANVRVEYEGLFTERLSLSGALAFSEQGSYTGSDQVILNLDPSEVSKQWKEARQSWEVAKPL